ncbi:MAG: hypothetical protein DWQ34_02505 [Planctomycetota bacterium]|nr:MAG: hypothetical protein DWQ34_02505 [Planctomycetota bacterium]
MRSAAAESTGAKARGTGRIVIMRGRSVRCWRDCLLDGLLDGLLDERLTPGDRIGGLTPRRSPV